MQTKKEQNSELPTTTLLRETFENQKFIRYLEKDYTKRPYVKRIIFFFPNKIQTTTYLKENEYKQWRKVLIKLFKTK